MLIIKVLVGNFSFKLFIQNKNNNSIMDGFNSFQEKNEYKNKK